MKPLLLAVFVVSSVVACKEDSPERLGSPDELRAVATDYCSSPMTEDISATDAGFGCRARGASPRCRSYLSANLMAGEAYAVYGALWDCELQDLDRLVDRFATHYVPHVSPSQLRAEILSAVAVTLPWTYDAAGDVQLRWRHGKTRIRVRGQPYTWVSGLEVRHGPSLDILVVIAVPH